MRATVVLVLALGCGRVGFEASDGRGTDTSTVDDAERIIDGSSMIPSGAALWLKLDDDPTDGSTDSSGSHVATCTSCPTLVAGRIAGAMRFTGAQRIGVTAAADLQPGTSFSVAAWVRVDAAPAIGNDVVVCKQANLDCSYALMISSAAFPVFYTAGSNSQTGPVAFAIGSWHHMAMTWNGSTKLGYVDGIAATNTGQMMIASDPLGDLGVGDRFAPNPIPLTGAIDDVVFYQRVLNAAEISQLANP